MNQPSLAGASPDPLSSSRASGARRVYWRPTIRDTPRMAKLLERFRAWRAKRAASPSTNPEQDKDWKTVGNTFRASDAVYDKYLPTSQSDEGRPPH